MSEFFFNGMIWSDFRIPEILFDGILCQRRIVSSFDYTSTSRGGAWKDGVWFSKGCSMVLGESRHLVAWMISRKGQMTNTKKMGQIPRFITEGCQGALCTAVSPRSPQRPLHLTVQPVSMLTQVLLNNLPKDVNQSVVLAMCGMYGPITQVSQQQKFSHSLYIDMTIQYQRIGDARKAFEDLYYVLIQRGDLKLQSQPKNILGERTFFVSMRVLPNRHHQ